MSGASQGTIENVYGKATSISEEDEDGEIELEYDTRGLVFKIKKDHLVGPAGAEKAWKTPDLICHHGGYLIDNGMIYGNHERGAACLDLKTG